MKKKYIMPTFQIEKFHVDNIMEESTVDVLNIGITDQEMGNIEFAEGNTLQSIDYRQFLKQ